jgi:serine/threonine-protein kinase HipA
MPSLKSCLPAPGVDPCLPFSRKEFFRGSLQSIPGMSISGVHQKLSLKLSEEYQLVTTVEDGEYIIKPSPETYSHAADSFRFRHKGDIAKI